MSKRWLVPVILFLGFILISYSAMLAGLKFFQRDPTTAVSLIPAEQMSIPKPLQSETNDIFLPAVSNPNQPSPNNPVLTVGADKVDEPVKSTTSLSADGPATSGQTEVEPIENTDLEVTETLPPDDPLCNGDFEAGPACWNQSSTLGSELISTSFNHTVLPHSGSGAAWLGGEFDEVAYIQQQFTIPANTPYLALWYWIDSTDSCGFDFGRIRINNEEIDGFDLCFPNNSVRWTQKVMDLSAYRGTSVTFQILTTTDDSYNSNLFIDDVEFQERP